MASLLNKLKRRISNAGDTMSLKSVKEEEENMNIEIPQEIYNWKLAVAAITAAAAAIIIGYDSGFIGTTVTLPGFEAEFTDSMSSSAAAEANSNVIAVFEVGAFFGALLCFPLSEIYGRKLVLMVSGFFMTFGAAISLAANKNSGLAAIYAGRVISGFGIGGCSGTSPIYIAEIAPAAIRGKLSGTWGISWQIGGIVGYWINYGVEQHVPNSSKQWMISFGVQLIPSVIFWAGTFLLIESPRFYAFKGNYEAAKKNLAYIRNLPEDHPYSIHELENIIKDVEEKKKSTGDGFMAPVKKIFTSPALIKRLVLSTSLFPMQNMMGINAITYYSPDIFKSLGMTGANATLMSTGIFGILKGVSAVVWTFFIVDQFGRRKALLWTSLPCSLCMWYLGAYIYVANTSEKAARGDTSSDPGGKAAQALLYIWSIFYGIAWNGTPWVINAEIFPQDVTTVSQAINASSNWFWTFVMSKWSGQAVTTMTYGFFFMLAALILFCPVVVFFFYPETKGVPLEAIEYLFEVPAWRAREYALAKFEVEYERGEYPDHEYSEIHESEKEKNEQKEGESFTS